MTLLLTKLINGLLEKQNLVILGNQRQNTFLWKLSFRGTTLVQETKINYTAQVWIEMNHMTYRKILYVTLNDFLHKN